MLSKTEQLDELRSLLNMGRSWPAAHFGLLENKLSYTESFYILHCPLSHSVLATRSAIVDLVRMRTTLPKWSAFRPHFA